MKKIMFLSLMVFLFSSGGSLLADNSTNTNDPAYRQAKQDYHAYLEQLKLLREQYRQVTSQVQQIVAEEGIPTWDEKSDQIKMTHSLGVDPAMQASLPTSEFGDADIKETDKDMIVKMDLPGVSKDQIKVKLEDSRVLKVSGSREVDKEEQKTTPDAKYYKAERQRGAFERSIKLPVPASESGIRARYENGVLTITIPKAQEVKKEVAVSIQ